MQNGCVIYDAINLESLEIIDVETSATCKIRCACDYASEANIRSYLKNFVKNDDWHLLMLLITRYSRLLDTSCGVPFGYFETAQINAISQEFIQITESNFLPLPPRILGSIESVRQNGITVSGYKEVENGLYFNACNQHISFCNCLANQTWNGCICVKARWGEDCIRHDVTEAVLSMVAQAFEKRSMIGERAVGLDQEPLLFEKRTLAWKTVVNRQLQNNEWQNYSIA
jgi:hypothetical protein